jgi:hypothetical protein
MPGPRNHLSAVPTVTFSDGQPPHRTAAEDEILGMPQGQPVTRGPSEHGETAKQWEALADWANRLPDKALECRVSGHRWPGWTDRRRTHISRERNGTYLINAECERKCGARITRHIDRDGYLSRNNIVRVEYDADYLMPAAARTGRGYSRAQRAYLRAEMLDRLAEAITDA